MEAKHSTSVRSTDNPPMEGLGALLRGALPFCPAAVVLVATFTRSKTVGAYVQLGSIQEREEVRERMKAEAKAAADAGAQSPNSKIAERRLWDKLAFTVGVMNVMITPCTPARPQCPPQPPPA